MLYYIIFYIILYIYIYIAIHHILQVSEVIGATPKSCIFLWDFHEKKHPPYIGSMTPCAKSLNSSQVTSLKLRCATALRKTLRPGRARAWYPAVQPKKSLDIYTIYILLFIYIYRYYYIYICIYINIYVWPYIYIDICITIYNI